MILERLPLADGKFSNKEIIPVLIIRHWLLTILTKLSKFLSCSLFLFFAFIVFLKNSRKNMNYFVRGAEFKSLVNYTFVTLAKLPHHL